MAASTVTSRAYANLALLKYWGVTPSGIAMLPSVSIPLRTCYTETTIELVNDVSVQEVEFIDAINEVPKVGIDRIRDYVTKFLKYFGKETGFRVRTFNSFPIGVGIASSASGFAALTKALAELVEVDLFRFDVLDLLALESGSALRSLKDGIVVWRPLNNLIEERDDLDEIGLIDLTCVVSADHKKVASKDLHKRVMNSTLIDDRVSAFENRYERLIKSMQSNDWLNFAKVVNEEVWSFLLQIWSCEEKVTMLNNKSLKVWEHVQKWQKEGLPVCVTFDAGPTIHVLTCREAVFEIQNRLSKLDYIEKIIVN